MRELTLGIIYKVEPMIVEAQHTALACGSGTLEVFATPQMVAIMESAAALCVQTFLDSGQSSVGVKIDIKHMCATPVGMSVWAVAVLKAVDRKKLTFDVEAYDERGLIGSGVHERFIINVDEFLKKAYNG